MPLKVVVWGTEDRQQMESPTPLPDVLRDLLEQPLDGPILRACRIEAGRRRLEEEPIDAVALADALVAEGPPLVERT